MLQKTEKINTGNRQSYMTAEYIFRYVEIGDVFTASFLLENVGFGHKDNYAKTGINLVLKKMLENRNGNVNIIVVSTDPTQETEYKLIDNQTSIMLEKHKGEQEVSVNAATFQTDVQHYKAPMDVIQALRGNLSQTLKHIPVLSEQKTFEENFKEQVEQMTDVQRNQAIMILFEHTSKLLEQTQNVLELMNNV